MGNVIKVIGYVVLALIFFMQLLAVTVTPMPKALIHIGILLVIGLWAGNKFKNSRNKAKSED